MCKCSNKKVNYSRSKVMFTAIQKENIYGVNKEHDLQPSLTFESFGSHIFFTKTSRV